MNWNEIFLLVSFFTVCSLVAFVAYWLGRQVGYSRGYHAGHHSQKRASNGRFAPNAPAKGGYVAK